MSRPLHLLITGAAGFIGSHLVEQLLRDGHRVLGVDDLSSGSLSNLKTAFGIAPDRLQLLEGSAEAVISGTLPGPRIDAVVHLAASVGVARIVDDPGGSAANNLRQTRAVLGFAERCRAAFLLASSSEVYGKCPVLPCREDADSVFGPTTASRWSYGLAKALDEHFALQVDRRGEARVVVARLFNTVGARQVGRYGMVVPRFVQAAASGGDLVVHGDGSQSRCFCDARDVAGALARLIADEANHRGVFNVGGDRPITIAGLAEEVRGRAIAAGLPGGRVVRRPHAEVYGPGFEDPMNRVPDLERIRAAIGWEPRIDLGETIDGLLREAGGNPR